MTKNKLDLAALIVAGLLAFAFCSPAQAGLYKCTDKNGRTYYQDKPCQDLIATRLPTWLNNLSGREEERAFMWKAVGEKGTLYLIGSPHYGNQTYYPFPQMVMDAFGNSQAVVLEEDLWSLSDRDRDAKLKGRGRYENKNDTLDGHVKPVTWEKAKEMGKKLGFNDEMLRMFKPWRVALMLSAESLKQAGYSPELSVVQSFLKEAQGKKPVMRLGDDIEEQIQQLEELSDREQEQLLLQTLQNLGRAPDIYKNIAEAWKKGDAESMDQITRQSYDSGDVSAKLFKVFFEDSNEKIVNRLKDMANEDKTLFVVMDAGRLGGDRGVLRLLQDKKLNVTQP